jgi:16S rRNA G527 N7-methylase RsmG
MIEVKTRKSVFLREAARELGLSDATVETSRHELLLSNPAFHEAFEALSVRAVRVEGKIFAALQSFVRPGGRILHFRSASEALPLLPPPLETMAVHRLGENERAQLLIIHKRPVRSTWNAAQ